MKKTSDAKETKARPPRAKRSVRNTNGPNGSDQAAGDLALAKALGQTNPNATASALTKAREIASEPSRGNGAARLQGRIERVSNSGIVGWAWDPRTPNRRIRLELMEGEICLKTTVAGEDRPDLVPLGCGDGRHGFTIELEQGLLANGPRTLVLRCAATAEAVPGSPIELKRSASGEVAYGWHQAAYPLGGQQAFRGRIDKVTETTITGWMIRPDRPMDRCIAVLKEGRRIIARAVASQLRPDLVSFGVADGCYGFVLEPSPSLADGEEHLLEVIEEQTGLPVTAQPILWRRDPSNLPPSLTDPLKTKERTGGRNNGRHQRIGPLRRSQGRCRADLQDRYYFRFEGPMKGDYSLAVVNRHFASALIQAGQEVVLAPPEQDLLDDAAFLQRPELLPRLHGGRPTSLTEIRSLNDWPVRDLTSSGINVIHCFAWEESIIPLEIAAQLSRFDLVTTTSSFVTRCLQNSGVTSPLATIGNGVDHISRAGMHRQIRSPDASKPFVFLHVSSCFPRKGVDVLLDAYFSEFSRSDNVQLVIKTYDNPHNRDLPREIAARRSQHESPPALDLRVASLDDEAYYRLFIDADCLVAPSYGEGFLLPAAEALLNNVPVIATNWGGHLDFCSGGATWLIDARLEKSASHVAGPGSMWAVPSMEHLRRLMREMTQLSVTERITRLVLGQQNLEQNFRWADVARRYLDSLASVLMSDFVNGPKPENRTGGRPGNARESEIVNASPNITSVQPAVGTWPGRHIVISTFGQRCGIATFAAELLAAASAHTEIIGVISELLDNTASADDAQAPAFAVRRVWRRHSSSVPDVVDAALQLRPDHVLIEHHPGIIGWDMLSEIVRRLHGKTKTTIELHSCAGEPSLIAAAPGLQFANRVIAHSGRDYMRVAGLFGTDKTSLIPHGIGVPLSARERPGSSTGGNSVRLVSFGMAGPHKGFHKVIEAMALLREAGLDVEYHLFTSLSSDNRFARQYLSYCIERGHQLGLQDHLKLNLEFQPIDDLLIKLNGCDIGVMVYDQDVAEGASGAARVMLRANLPLVLSSGPIFEEFQGTGVTVNGTGLALAQALYQLALSPDRRSEVLERQTAFISRTSWSNVAKMVFGYFDAY